jgi:acetyl esterase/lipase
MTEHSGDADRGNHHAGDRLQRLSWALQVCRDAQTSPSPSRTIDDVRAAVDAFTGNWPAPADTGQGTTSIAHLLVHTFAPLGAPPRDRILHVHGGGFTTGCGRAYGGLLGRLALEADAQVLACDYRLSPEHRFPAAIEDVDGVLDELLAPPGSRLSAVSADSAGGAIAVAAILRRLRRGAAVPESVVLFSPVLDLTASTASYQDNDGRDPMLTQGTIRRMARAYAGEHALEDPEVSPLLAPELTGFPPTAIYAGLDEVLRDDAIRFAQRLSSQGVVVRLQLESGVPHVWQIFGDSLVEARESIGDAARFIREANGSRAEES